MSELDRIEEKGDISDIIYGFDEEDFIEYDDAQRDPHFGDKVLVEMLDRYDSISMSRNTFY